MANLDLPISLRNKAINTDDFSYEEDSPKIENEFQDGSYRSRVKPSTGYAKMHVSFILNQKELVDFRNFFQVDCLWGTKEFNFYNPLDFTKVEVKIIGNPIYQPFGTYAYRLSLNLIITKVI